MKSAVSTVATSVLAIVLIALPWLLSLVHLNVSLGTQVILFALAASSVNIILGFTGLMAFGNAAFFGVGAYGSALFAQYAHADLLLSVVVGALAGMLSAMIIGPFLIRRRGIYFSLLTIAFGQVYYFIAYRTNGITGGEDGLTSERPALVGSVQLHDQSFYYFALVLFAIMMIALAYLTRSPFGRTLRAIGQNELRVRYLGIDSNRFIFISLVLAGLYAGLAGSLYSMSINFSYPLLMDWHQSGDFVMMVVLGGVGTLWGPLVGATIYTIGANVLSTATQTWQIWIGALFVLCVLLFPKGVLGFLGAGRSAPNALDVQSLDAKQGDAEVAIASAPYATISEGKP